MEGWGWIAGGAVHDNVVEESGVVCECREIHKLTDSVDIGVLAFLHVELIFLRDVAFLDYEGVETFAYTRC